MVETSADNQCQYCGRVFSRPTSLQAHLCEPRRRRSEQHERGVQMGFAAYMKFFEVTQGSAVTKTFDDFADSAYYRAFVKFGRYCQSIRAISPEHYVEWLLENHKKLDRWTSDTYYDQYLVGRLLAESVDTALIRGMEHAQDWADSNAAQSCDFLRYGNANRVCYAITTGRISAWIIYNCDSGQRFLSGLDSMQLSSVWNYIDSDLWQRKFQQYPADQIYCQDMLNRAGW
jgi:hypothetical protein